MKKDKELVKQESDKLYNEIIENNYSQDIAKQISDDMRKKGGYLFNKSHSQSYAVICWQTAYLKYYYPLYFFKALFNLNKDKAGMINKYILDAKSFGVEILPPNINKSAINFSISDNKILFGLSAIKGIGEKYALQIIQERELNGKFKSLDDFIARMNPTKTQMIYLIKSGAIPSTDKMKTIQKYFMSVFQYRTFKPLSSVPSPYSKLSNYGLNVDDYRIDKKVDKETLLNDVNKIKKQIFDQDELVRKSTYQNEISDKYLKNKEFWEFEALQIFLNDNPFDKVYDLIVPFEDIEIGDKCTIVGIISKVQKKKDRNKKQFAFINIYSSFGLVEGTVWHSTLRQYEDLIKNGTQIALLVKKDDEDKVIVEKIKPYHVWLKQKGVNCK